MKLTPLKFISASLLGGLVLMLVFHFSIGSIYQIPPYEEVGSKKSWFVLGLLITAGVLWAALLSNVDTSDHPQFICHQCGLQHPLSVQVNLHRADHGKTMLCKRCWNAKCWPNELLKRI